MKTIEATARSTGSPDAIWALLADASTWARWGSWKEVSVEGGGPQEEGAIRVLKTPPWTVRERITEVVPGQRTSYELIEGLKVRGYRSTVSLEPDPGGGTLVRWRSTYERAGPFTALLLRFAVRDACKRLAKAAA